MHRPKQLHCLSNLHTYILVARADASDIIAFVCFHVGARAFCASVHYVFPFSREQFRTTLIDSLTLFRGPLFACDPPQPTI